MVDTLGILFWVILLSGSAFHVIYARIPLQWLLKDLADAAMLMICIVWFAGISGYITGGDVAAIGQSVGTSLWCICGFSMWTTVRWKRNWRESMNYENKTTAPGDSDSKP